MKTTKSNNSISTIQIRYALIHTDNIPLFVKKINNWKKKLPSNIHLIHHYMGSFISYKLIGISTSKEQQNSFEIKKKEFSLLIEKNIVSKEEIAPEKILTELLKKKNLTIATAESCTGGTIATFLSKHPGSSSYYKGSVIAYCNEIKHKLLGVEEQILNTKGAVCQETIEQMAKGVCQQLKSDIGIATSGIAGPNSDSSGTPVGTIWIAVSDGQQTITKKLSLGKNRKKNILYTTYESFFLAKDFVENKK